MNMILGLNYFFGERDLGDRFLTENEPTVAGRSARAFAHRLMRLFDVDVHSIGHYRKLFSKIFTWDERLAARNPGYVLTNVFPGVDAELYRGEKYKGIPFAEKKLLFAASTNRWHYMPQSTFGERRRIYKYFEEHQPDQFDFFGQGWNAPAGPFERYIG